MKRLMWVATAAVACLDKFTDSRNEAECILFGSLNGNSEAKFADRPADSQNMCIGPD